MVDTFSKSLIQPAAGIPPDMGLSVMMGAMVWVLIASRIGLPVSTTHALTGALVGSALTAFGGHGFVWPTIIGKIALPLLLSPVLALALSTLIHPLIRSVADRWEGSCLCLMPESRALVTIDVRGATRTLYQTTAFGRPITDVPANCDRAGLRGLTIGLDAIHWTPTGFASLARGTNDAPKLIAILLMGASASSSVTPIAWTVAFFGVALAMGSGNYLGGLRVTQVLAEGVTRIDHAEGLSANLTTSTLVLVSATMGLPVSTTHVSSSAIIGIGLLKGHTAVSWSTVRTMVLAWLARCQSLNCSLLLSILP
jgi:PiT family inorganic phosphate transporter